MYKLIKFIEYKCDIFNNENLANDSDIHNDFQDKYFDLYYTSGFFSFLAKNFFNINNLSIQEYYDRLVSKYPNNKVIKRAKEELIDKLEFQATH